MVYIRSAAALSPQPTFGNPSFDKGPVVHQGNSLRCAEPDYAGLIDPRQIRRMSRIIRIGVATALDCLRRTGIPEADGSTFLDGIITGTAYGCLEDTEIFLKRLVDNQEEMLTPTAFIQSTHNTVGAQIALLLHCHAYNNTYVHRAFSFESAVLDALLLLGEGTTRRVLVGGLDEITDTSHTLLGRFGRYREGEIQNMTLYDRTGKGTLHGEGAAFFLLEKDKAVDSQARLDGLTTWYKPRSTAESLAHIATFLSVHRVEPAGIDGILIGRNGNATEDQWYEGITPVAFPGIPVGYFKHLCGEYPTASAFALWLAVRLLKEPDPPPGWLLGPGGSPVRLRRSDGPLRRLLIYNQYHNSHHSLFLITAC